LRKRVAELREFEPMSLHARRSPEVTKLEAAIDETLRAVFGNATAKYRLYMSAADLEPPHVVNVTPSWIAARGGGMTEREDLYEFRMQVVERKQRAIVLLEQAIEALEEEFMGERPEPPGEAAPVPNSPPTANDAPMSDADLAEIREVISTIKRELPALELSNSAKADISADINQIEVETERPTPRRRFMKLYLESLRDNLAKAAGAATVGGALTLIGLVAGLLAKYFGIL
jgi:hypothetical protein